LLNPRDNYIKAKTCDEYKLHVTYSCKLVDKFVIKTTSGTIHFSFLKTGLMLMEYRIITIFIS